MAVHAVTLSSSVLDTCRHHFTSWEWTATVPLPVSDDTVVLIQGSRSFLLSLPDHLLRLSSAVSFNYACMVWQRPLGHAGWHTATYCFTDYGGVICGRWRMASCFHLPSSLDTGHSTFPALRLRHFLDPTIRGGLKFHLSIMQKL